MQENQNHQIQIEQKKKITVSGVDCVKAFSEVKILLSLVGGEKLHVGGFGLKITGFVKASGIFTAEGNITGVSYGGKSFASKLLR